MDGQLQATPVLKQRIKELLISELRLTNVTPEAIVDQAPLFAVSDQGGLGLDSLDALQLAVALEENFGVRVPDEATGKIAFASVDALTAYVAKHSSRAS